jgi:hypothetical protein
VAGVVVGTVVGGATVAAIDESESTTTTTTTTTTYGPPTSELPCEPNIMNSNGVTYYLCGGQFYVQAYGDGGLMYMPVDPPR